MEDLESAFLLGRRVLHLSGEPPSGAVEPLRDLLAGSDRRLDDQDAGGERGVGSWGRHGERLSRAGIIVAGEEMRA